MNKTIKLLSKQKEFILSDKKFTLYSGGLGAGKSYVLAVWIILKTMQEPKTRGLILNATYSQLRDTTLSTLFGLLEDLNIPYNFIKSQFILQINNNADIYCRSMDKADTLRGLEVGFIAMDEASLYRKNDFLIAIGRLRKGQNLQCKIATTPKGFNYLYELFISHADENKHFITSSSRDNHHLPTGYIDSLANNYDSLLAKQEIDGEFINTNGMRTYYAFEQTKNISPCQINNTHQIYIGMDFNITPMTAVICQYYNGIIYVIDELFLKNANTEMMSIHIKHKYNASDCSVIPDSTGSRSQTCSSKSDFVILEEQGLKVERVRNPSRKDRFNCVNNLLSKSKIKISPTCINLIKDLNLFVDEANKDALLGHISDAFGYVCWHLLPIRPQSTSTGTTFL